MDKEVVVHMNNGILLNHDMKDVSPFAALGWT